MKSFITILVQLVVGVIATMGIYISGIGNGWELVAFPIVHAIVVCVVGIVIHRMGGGDHLPLPRIFIGTLIGGAIGSAFLLIPIAWGFQGVLLPLVAAVTGYQLAVRL